LGERVMATERNAVGLTVPIVRAEGLCVGYNMVPVLPALDMSFYGGNLYGICGANGIGKSSVLRALANLGGRISGVVKFEINGEQVEGEEARKRGWMLYLPQRRSCFLEMSVKENLETISRRCWTEAMNQVACLWGDGNRVVAPLAGKDARCLSGGERQIVAVAALLASRASAFLLDEPSEGLAAQMRDSMYEGSGSAW